jgi:hypothetical protein
MLRSTRASPLPPLHRSRPSHRYLPDEYRGVIMNLFAIPLNLIVVGVFLSISKLGLAGALTISTLALSGATLAQLALRRCVS